MERYPDFENLEKNESRGADYRILWRVGTSGIAVFSIHGGEIEPGTTRIANAIAGWEHSFYAFEGTKTSGNLALHITSNRFDEPKAMEIVRQSEIVISIHGSAKTKPLVELGGLDEELKHRILHELRDAGFQAEERDRLPFCATNRTNICNLCGRGMGAQMEISRGLRATMFRNLTPEGRRYHTAAFVRFTESVRKAIAPFAALYAETRPLLNTD